MKPPAVHIYNPDGLDLTAVLPSGLHRQSDCVRYLLHRIIQGRIARPDQEFVAIKAKDMRSFFPNTNAYTATKAALIERGVIVSDNHYLKGEKSMGFKLGREYANRRYCRIQVQDKRLAEKITRHRELAAMGRVESDVHRHLWRCLTELEIDYQAGLDTWLNGPCDAEVELSMRMIRDGDFFLKACRFGRVHTNLTNLKSGMRRFLTHRGRPLVNLDIRNSQPLFFGVLLRESYRSKPMPDDVRHYLELVQAGRFYDHLMESWGVTIGGRAEFKQEFFGHVFFCANEPEREWARRFGELFPDVYAAIRSAKAEDYRALAHCLQRAESSLMIRSICGRIMVELPDAWIATIHDSILTTPDRAESVLRIMGEEFSRVGLEPTINREPLI